MDLRHKLGLLVLEEEPETKGLLRIAFDQARRTEARQEAQRRMSKVKIPKLPKPKKPKEVKTNDTSGTARKRTRKRQAGSSRDASGILQDTQRPAKRTSRARKNGPKTEGTAPGGAGAA